MPTTPQEKDNITRWNPLKKGFFEVYDLTWNDPSQKIAGWFRYTLLARQTGEPEASVLGVFFDSQNADNNTVIRKTYTLHEMRIEKEIFYFSAGPSAIFETGTRGGLADEKNKMSWELKYGESALSLRHLPTPLYLGGFPKTKIMSPYFSGKISGDFTLNDRSFSLHDLPARQSHLWGTGQSNAWTWGGSNAFEEDPDFCFEGLSTEVMIADRTAPPMTLLFFHWEGKTYRFNSPIHWIKNVSRFESHQPQSGVEGAMRAPVIIRWHFEAEAPGLRFVGNLSADTQEMVRIRDEDPTGGERFHHATRVATAKISILRRNKSGWQLIKELTAPKMAAFEVAQPTASYFSTQTNPWDPGRIFRSGLSPLAKSNPL